MTPTRIRDVSGTNRHALTVEGIKKRCRRSRGTDATMSQQPAEEWEDMDPKTQDEIMWQASVLAEIRDTKAAAPIHRHIVMRPGGRLAHLPGI